VRIEHHSSLDGKHNSEVSESENWDMMKILSSIPYSFLVMNQSMPDNGRNNLVAKKRTKAEIIYLIKFIASPE
jgi:hypothetical protein